MMKPSKSFVSSHKFSLAYSRVPKSIKEPEENTFSSVFMFTMLIYDQVS